MTRQEPKEIPVFKELVAILGLFSRGGVSHRFGGRPDNNGNRSPGVLPEYYLKPVGTRTYFHDESRSSR
jgi:hypothetical protein